MVRQGDFDVSIVHADTRLPFKEHTKDGKIFVEVEPNAEYFIRIQRLGNTVQGPLLAGVSVDEKSLGYQNSFPSIGEPYYSGLRTRIGDTSTHTALKFTKPRPTAQEGGGKQQPSRMLMGKVEVKIYKGIFDKRKTGLPKSFKSTWEESTVDQAHAGSLAKKKGLRSGQGLTSVTKQKSGKRKSYKRGSKVDVFTLNYCAAMGLIEVGVLPKPALWVQHRMLHPSKKRSAAVAAAAADSITSNTTTTAASIIRPTKMIRSQIQENELFDLSNINDDSDEDINE